MTRLLPPLRWLPFVFSSVVLLVATTGAFSQVQVSERVFLVEDPQASALDFQMVVRAGCADEAGGCRGIAHYLEHLVLAGRDGKSENAALPTFRGMMSNGWTTSRATAYTHRVPVSSEGPKATLERLFRFYAARLRPFEITRELEARERQIVLQEYDWRLGSSPAAPLLRKIDQQLFGDHPLGSWPIGHRNEILGLKAADAKAFHESWYHLPNVVFAIRGNLTPELVREVAEKALADLPTSAALPPRPSERAVEVDAARMDIVVQEEKATQRSIVLRKLFRMPEREEMAELAMLTVLNQMLASRLPGSLHDFVVERRKIPNESLSASLARIQPGLFLLDLRADIVEGIDSAVLAGALEDFQREAGDLAPSARNIERMRRRSIEAMSERSKAPERVYPELVQWLAAGRPFSEFGRMPVYLERVTDAEIAAAYAAFSGPGRLVSGVLIPKERARP
ncbi:MAG: insulinase family protein [Methylobacterium sp.]|nr:insulinase family protein [Methylobacterium sp.]MCA3614414.1 insulinase family protein [Methylobacterium sp.]